jgi:menaquinone-dependent protoporphyrinogen oxidase
MPSLTVELTSQTLPEEAVKILVVYGTTEGQTRKIAEWTASRLRQQGHQVELRDSASRVSDLDLTAFDAFIVAGSVHHEHHQKAVTNFVIAHRELLNTKASAFISVSLSAILEDEKTEARKYVDHFVSVTGWTPYMTLLIGGAARFSEYDYFQEQVIKFIVMKRGGLEAQGQDREFTDWNELGAFIDKFIAEAI